MLDGLAHERPPHSSSPVRGMHCGDEDSSPDALLHDDFDVADQRLVAPREKHVPFWLSAWQQSRASRSFHGARERLRLVAVDGAH
jgi:hypothetical protein